MLLKVRAGPAGYDGAEPESVGVGGRLNTRLESFPRYIALQSTLVRSNCILDSYKTRGSRRNEPEMRIGIQ